MAVILEGGCRVSQMHDGEPLVHGTLRVWRQVGRATGAHAISLSVMEFAPGLSAAMHNGDCDQILYLLNDEVGAARGVGLVSIDGRSYEISADSGIYIRPKKTFAINNRNSNPLTIISSQCPDPERGPEFVDEPATQSVAESGNASPIVRLSDQKAQPTADRSYRVLIDERAGSTQVTQFVGSIPPGRAPDHFHQYEEVLFILRGEGRMWAGESNTPIAAGSCIYLPKGQVHCVENTGDGELRLLGVFYPAGSPSVRYDA
ncbi:MAG TPA: cupin domain-containing protein [Pyrinomonadaceae bacterium]|jgi:mannose-6-phosphate isomerase-like protein (cupin superfamily)|nr:cupin domain-containing protein [Pyrinomonadaceae bacterium]